MVYTHLYYYTHFLWIVKSKSQNFAKINEKSAFSEEEKGGMILTEEIDYTHYKECDYYKRKNEGHIASHPLLDLYTLTGIRFLGKVLPAPAVSYSTEYNENKRA